MNTKRLLLALCLAPMLLFAQPPTTNYPVLKFDPATGNFVPSTTNGHTIQAGVLALGGFSSITGRVGNANLPLGAVLYDNAGTPKIAADFNSRGLFDSDGNVFISWSDPGLFAVDGNLTASAFFGDGSNLTSLYGLTLVANQSVRRNTLNTAYEAFTAQPIDADLVTWAAITRASGFDTFATTPSGANLASLLTTALPGSKGGIGYLVYAALLTQTGTSAPTATVLANTLGGTVVWTYSTGGTYIGTLVGAFPSGKVPTMDGTIFAFAGVRYHLSRASNDTVQLLTGSELVELGNDYLSSTFIEIRVYP